MKNVVKERFLLLSWPEPIEGYPLSGEENSDLTPEEGTLPEANREEPELPMDSLPTNPVVLFTDKEKAEDCHRKKWQQDKYFKGRGIVSERFCDEFSEGKKSNCQRALRNLKKAIRNIEKTGERYDELEDKAFELRIKGPDLDSKTEMGGLCIECVERLQKAQSSGGLADCRKYFLDRCRPCAWKVGCRSGKPGCESSK